MELLEALRVIKEECTKTRFCKNCPLRTEILEDGRTCSVMAVTPNNWNIKEFDEVPRLFK